MYRKRREHEMHVHACDIHHVTVFKNQVTRYAILR